VNELQSMLQAQRRRTTLRNPEVEELIATLLYYFAPTARLCEHLVWGPPMADTTMRRGFPYADAAGNRVVGTCLRAGIAARWADSGWPSRERTAADGLVEPAGAAGPARRRSGY